jgi:hypothetical protein
MAIVSVKAPLFLTILLICIFGLYLVPQHAVSISNSPLQIASWIVLSTAAYSLISVLSWDKKAPVEIAVGSQALIGSSSSELDFQRYNNHNLVKNECSKHAMIDGTKTLRVKVGVYPSGQTGVTPFCVRLSGFQDQARRLVMNPIETGDLAGLTVACTDGQYYFDKDFRSDRPSSEDYQNGYSFSATLKGLIGLCEFRHYEEYPASNRWGTWGEVELSLQK